MLEKGKRGVQRWEQIDLTEAAIRDPVRRPTGRLFLGELQALAPAIGGHLRGGSLDGRTWGGFDGRSLV
jgi:hypothetical protein